MQPVKTEKGADFFGSFSIVALRQDLVSGSGFDFCFDFGSGFDSDFGFGFCFGSGFCFGFDFGFDFDYDFPFFASP